MSESSVLSQNEVDALLKGISGGEFEVYDGPIERVKQQFNRWGMAKLTKFLRDPFGVKKREYDAQRRKRVAQRREFDAQWTFNWKVPSSFNQNIPVVIFSMAETMRKMCWRTSTPKTRPRAAGTSKFRARTSN